MEMQHLVWVIAQASPCRVVLKIKSYSILQHHFPIVETSELSKLILWSKQT